jgi:hypothetical protein
MAARPDGQRYYNKRGVPRKISADRVLAHNRVRHTVDMPDGQNGFRCWTWPLGKVPRNFKRCKCRWSGLPHYRLRFVSPREDAQSDRCITKAQLAAGLR